MRNFVAAALITLMVSQAGWAQTDSNTFPSLQRGVTLRVDFRDGTILKGKFDNLAGEKLRLSRNAGVVDIDRKHISKLYRTRGSIGRSVALGTLIGAGSGTTMGLVSGGRDSGGWVDPSRGEVAAAGAIAGGLIGAGVGLLVGALRKKDVVIFEARP
jgi:hypothetical protein